MKLEGIPTSIHHKHDVNLHIKVDEKTLVGFQAIVITAGFMVATTVFMKGIFHA